MGTPLVTFTIPLQLPILPIETKYIEQRNKVKIQEPYVIKQCVSY